MLSAGIGIWFRWARVQTFPIVFDACFEIAIDDSIEKIVDENQRIVMTQSKEKKYKYFANS